MVMVGNMVKALEAEGRLCGAVCGTNIVAVGELQADLVPILSRAPNPIMAEAALLQEMEQGVSYLPCVFVADCLYIFVTVCLCDQEFLCLLNRR